MGLVWKWVKIWKWIKIAAKWLWRLVDVLSWFF